MKLSQEEKDDLESLKRQPWYKVLLKIEKEANDELFSRLATFDLDNKEDVLEVKKYQIYQRARNDFFQNIESYTREVFNNNIKGIDY